MKFNITNINCVIMFDLTGTPIIRGKPRPIKPIIDKGYSKPPKKKAKKKKNKSSTTVIVGLVVGFIVLIFFITCVAW